MKTLTKNDIGILIDCSCYSADRLNYRTIEFAAVYGLELDSDEKKLLARFRLDVMREDDSESLSWSADRALDYLNGLELPSYCSFYFEDNSLFLAPCIENAREDIEFVSSRKNEYPADDYRG